MILTLEQFENSFNKTFGKIDTVSLSNVTNNRIRIELGDDLLNANQRIKNILFKCNLIFINILKEKDIWLKITFWDNIGKQNLMKAGLDLLQADLVFDGSTKENDILIINKKEMCYEFIHPLILSHINYELGKKPFANITCYFINFEIPMILNIYDDRGLDIISPNNFFLNEIRDEFKDWVIA